jgi:hypothetical protein
MNSHVRKFATGEFSNDSQDLLNELAKAMLCLTDSRRKGEYDASLGRKDAPAGRKRTLEEILIAAKAVDPARLDKARHFADAVGMDMRDALVQQKLADPSAVMMAYAESIGIPFLELDDITLDGSLIPRMPAVLARRNSCAPIMAADGYVLVASPNPLSPDLEEELRLRIGSNVRAVLCTPAAIHKVIDRHYTREAAAAEMAAAGTGGKAAGSASTTTSGGQSALDPQARAELRKHRIMISAIAFNFTVLAVSVVVAFLVYPFPGLVMSFLYSLGPALLVAGIAWFMTGRRS